MINKLDMILAHSVFSLGEIDINYMSTWLLTITKAKEGNQWGAMKVKSRGT